MNDKYEGCPIFNKHPSLELQYGLRDGTLDVARTKSHRKFDLARGELPVLSSGVPKTQITTHQRESDWFSLSGFQEDFFEPTKDH